MDDKFQEIIINIINKNNIKCLYKKDAVKQLKRCQFKVETEYNNEKFPQSSHLLDCIDV